MSKYKASVTLELEDDAIPYRTDVEADDWDEVARKAVLRASKTWPRNKAQSLVVVLERQ